MLIMRIFNNILIVLIGALITFSSPNSYAADMSQIYNELEDYLHNELSNRYHGKIVIKPTRLDGRFKLKSCDLPYEYELPARASVGSRTTVIVSCQSPSWSMYLPVDVAVYNNAVVNVRPISRGEIINSDDLAIQKANITTLSHGFFDDMNEVIGLSATQNIKMNTVIKPRLIEKPVIINRGDLVSIIGKARGFEIRTSGIAMTEGTMGSSIQVKNTTSKKIIDSTVAGPGKVIVHTR